ncbi:hypothetical protein D9M71_775190 [compost metagenome]
MKVAVQRLWVQLQGLVDTFQQLHFRRADLSVDLGQVSKKRRYSSLRRLGQRLQFFLQALQGWRLAQLQTQMGFQALAMRTAQVIPGVNMLG